MQINTKYDNMTISDEIDSSHTHTLAYTHTNITNSLYLCCGYLQNETENMRNKTTDMETGRVRQHSIAVVFDIQTVLLQK